MNSRELCRRAIEFDYPERLPLSYPSWGLFDFALLPYTEAAGWRPAEPGADEWGAVWKQTDVPNMGQMVKHPLDDWSALDTYTFPDPDDMARFDFLAEKLDELPDKFIVAMSNTVLTLWERYYSLRGFNNALLDFYAYPDEMHALLERILDVHVRIAANLKTRFGGRVDGFLVSDDWGTQNSTLVALPLWREFFKERYRRLVAAIHDGGMKAILHSDGHINDLFPDLIEVGFDAFNLHSPTVVGIEEVGRLYAGKVAFFPCIDIQNTVVHSTPEDVREEARLLLGWWGTKKGGIVPCEYDCISIGAPPENVRAAYEEYCSLELGYSGALNGK